MQKVYNQAQDVINFIKQLRRARSKAEVAKLLGKYLIGALQYCSGSHTQFYSMRILQEQHLFFGKDCDISSADHFDRTWKNTLTNVTNKSELDDDSLYYVAKFNTQAIVPTKYSVIKLLQDTETSHYSPLLDRDKTLNQDATKVYQTLGIKINPKTSIKLATETFKKHQELGNLRTQIVYHRMQIQNLQSKLDKLTKLPVREFKI